LLEIGTSGRGTTKGRRVRLKTRSIFNSQEVKVNRELTFSRLVVVTPNLLEPWFKQVRGYVDSVSVLFTFSAVIRIYESLQTKIEMLRSETLSLIITLFSVGLLFAKTGIGNSQQKLQLLQLKRSKIHAKH